MACGDGCSNGVVVGEGEESLSSSRSDDLKAGVPPPPPPALRPHRCIGVWLPGTGGMCFCHEAQAHGREHGEDADNGTCDTSRYNMHERCLPNRLPFRNLFGPDFFIPMNNQEWTVLSI